MTSWAFKNQY